MSEHVLGRPEHTDAVPHDGTWHYQLEGSKEWRLRPTDELLARLGGATKHGGGKQRRASHKKPAAAVQTVLCEPGDLLVVSTREWWHATRLPPQAAPNHLSISYARDFVLGAGTTKPVADADAALDSMSNVDGLFARSSIEAGTVVMTQDDLPDCELPESDEPNCEVCEDEESGLMCLVAIRDICSGEFLTVPIDDDE